MHSKVYLLKSSRQTIGLNKIQTCSQTIGHCSDNDMTWKAWRTFRGLIQELSPHRPNTAAWRRVIIARLCLWHR